MQIAVLQEFFNSFCTHVSLLTKTKGFAGLFAESGKMTGMLKGSYTLGRNLRFFQKLEGNDQCMLDHFTLSCEVINVFARSKNPKTSNYQSVISKTSQYL